MAEFSNQKAASANKMMLGFIVRRCAADLGHAPTPDEFATWANEQRDGANRYCLFGKAISPSVAKVMFRQPGRLVSISQEGLSKISKAPQRQ